MIAYLKGTITAKNASGVIVDVGGVGYELSCSTQTLATLPGVGATATVWTYMQVKDDSISLYGFADLREKEMLERLIGVAGIGPKMAVAALSTFKAEELAGIIAAGDVASIATIPGVGKKTAQRVVLELQGVLKNEVDDAGTAHTPHSATMREATEALKSMGFTEAETAAALQLCEPAQDASAIILQALKVLGGK